MLKGQLGCAGCLGGLEVASVPAHGGNVSLPASWVRNAACWLRYFRGGFDPRGSATTQMSLSLGTLSQDTRALFPCIPYPIRGCGDALRCLYPTSAPPARNQGILLLPRSPCLWGWVYPPPGTAQFSAGASGCCDSTENPLEAQTPHISLSPVDRDVLMGQNCCLLPIRWECGWRTWRADFASQGMRRGGEATLQQGLGAVCSSGWPGGDPSTPNLPIPAAAAPTKPGESSRGNLQKASLGSFGEGGGSWGRRKGEVRVWLGAVSSSTRRALLLLWQLRSVPIL